MYVYVTNFQLTTRNLTFYILVTVYCPNYINFILLDFQLVITMHRLMTIELDFFTLHFLHFMCYVYSMYGIGNFTALLFALF